MPSAALRVGALQLDPVEGEVATNVATLARWVRVAGDAGVRLLVTPEAVTTGYDLDLLAGPLPRLDADATAPGGWLEPLQEAVDASGVVVVLDTALETEPDTGGSSVRTLSDVVLRPVRPPVVAYAKQHLHPPERAHLTAGPHGASLVVDGVVAGLGICHDAGFPEHAADAAAGGAELYVVSGAFFPGGSARRELQHAARALDNGMYVAFAGLVGGRHRCVGGSAVYDPEGVRVADVGETGPGLAVADVDPDRLADVRTRLTMHAERRDLGERVLLDLDAPPG